MPVEPHVLPLPTPDVRAFAGSLAPELSPGAARLLCLLTADKEVSGETLARVLGVSRAAVWKEINKLRSLGYEIEAATRRGYQLVTRPDHLTTADIQSFRQGTPTPLVVFDCVEGSTNRVCKALAEQDPARWPHGAAVVSNTQTGGRGQRGRVFISPPNVGLYLSVCLRTPWLETWGARLTQLTAVQVRAAIHELTGLTPDIKWVNDLLWQEKKLCGILTEGSFEAESGRMGSAVVGIGINCRRFDFPADIPGISLDEIGGTFAPRAALCARILDKLEEMTRWEEPQVQACMDSYRAACVTVGRAVTVRHFDTVRNAFTEGLTPDGALLVRYDDGTTEALTAGDVQIRATPT